MPNLFVYGTLMFPEVLEIVLGHPQKSDSALLEEYRRYALRTEVFPIIRSGSGHRVKGLIIRDLSSEDIERVNPPTLCHGSPLSLRS
ncbi:gamma-glutamylcyclotransferase [Candidatus Peregrinibacteria bacterium]|nr:gamma-glutamylcyclotransferase [Candidatus Peregrinibacteria bacterium]MBI3816172.1 gamma-glutamylcyclotransferase [Candidatus Peregrinibacteria bacterium]